MLPESAKTEKQQLFFQKYIEPKCAIQHVLNVNIIKRSREEIKWFGLNCELKFITQNPAVEFQDNFVFVMAALPG